MIAAINIPMITEIAEHFHDVFIDNWTGCEVAFDGQPPVDLTNEDIWARFVVRMNDQKVRSFGVSKMTDQRLRLYLQIFSRKGEGIGPALDTAQEFIELFRYYRHLETDFSISGDEPQLTTMDAEEDWIQVNVSIPMTASFRA